MTHTVHKALNGMDNVHVPHLCNPPGQQFGYLGNQAAMDQVLNGTYQCPDGSPEYAANSLKNYNDLRHLPCCDRKSHYCQTQSWLEMHENTNRSQSFWPYIIGIHSPVMPPLQKWIQQLCWMPPLLATVPNGQPQLTLWSPKRNSRKTAYRISKDWYGCVQFPFQGAVLQGNRAGPTILMLISIPLNNMLRSQGFGFKSTNILTGEALYKFAYYTYVDDTC
jgi:hypothetical protein